MEDYIEFIDMHDKRILKKNGRVDGKKWAERQDLETLQRRGRWIYRDVLMLCYLTKKQANYWEGFLEEIRKRIKMIQVKEDV